MNIYFDVNIPAYDAGFFVSDYGFRFEYNSEEEYFLAKDISIRCKIDTDEDPDCFEVSSVNIVEDSRHITVEAGHPIYQAIFEWIEKDPQDIMKDAAEEANFNDIYR